MEETQFLQVSAACFKVYYRQWGTKLNIIELGFISLSVIIYFLFSSCVLYITAYIQKDSFSYTMIENNRFSAAHRRKQSHKCLFKLHIPNLLALLSKVCQPLNSGLLSSVKIIKIFQRATRQTQFLHCH